LLLVARISLADPEAPPEPSPRPGHILTTLRNGMRVQVTVSVVSTSVGPPDWTSAAPKSMSLTVAEQLCARTGSMGARPQKTIATIESWSKVHIHL
jgi:hypothetical protein